jgi:hypothetical protein
MAGLRISTEPAPEGPLTMLEGEVRDQAQLTGVLDALTDLNLTLISVHSLPASPSGGTGVIDGGGAASTGRGRSK